jgi:hypothetical protein
LVVVLSMTLFCHVAAAEDAHDRAARTFDEAERAFSAGAYARAGALFEEAYAIAPHPSALINAAKARVRASEPARAANLFARVLATRAAAKDREEARAALDELQPVLGRISVRADGPAVDGVSVERGAVYYVDPGEHEVTGRVRGELASRTVFVPRGQLVDVTLVAVAVPLRPDADRRPSHEGGGLPPVVTYVLGGATIVAAAITTWSGVEVLTQKDRFDRTGADEDLDEGFARQKRTNVLLGVTVGLGVITGVVALFTQWRAPSSSARLDGALHF